jgi:hypothetical protein
MSAAKRLAAKRRCIWVIFGAAHRRVIRSTGKSLGVAVDHRPMRPRPAVWMLHGDVDSAPESAGEFVADRRDAVVIPAQHHVQMLWAALATACNECAYMLRLARMCSNFGESERIRVPAPPPIPRPPIRLQ